MNFEPLNTRDKWHAELKAVLLRLDNLHRDAPCCDDTGPCVECERLEQAIELLGLVEDDTRRRLEYRGGREGERWAG